MCGISKVIFLNTGGVLMRFVVGLDDRIDDLVFRIVIAFFGWSFRAEGFFFAMVDGVMREGSITNPCSVSDFEGHAKHTGFVDDIGDGSLLAPRKVVSDEHFTQEGSVSGWDPGTQSMCVVAR
jgi:hypothetical protein